MDIYMDNSATTKVADEVKEIVLKVMTEDFGNPSSKHIKGVEAEKYIKDAKQIIASSLKVKDKEIFFTSGGTESNNLAIIGAANAYKRSGNHIITSKIEHPSVINPFVYLEEQGFDVSYVGVDSQGHIDEEELKSLLRPDTILVSFMMTNNEVGATQDVKRLVDIIRENNKATIIHVDAVQAYAKYKIFPSKWGVDLLSVSGHKLHGPKGIGFLYIKEKTKIKPIILGGNQQDGIRSGTENVPGIAGLGLAAKLAYEGFDEKIAHMREIRDFMSKEFAGIEGVSVNNETGDNAPHIVSASFEGVKSEVFLHSLEDKGIYVSSGSACSTHKRAPSGTLVALGVKKELLDCTLRFSLCDENTMDEAKYVVEAVKELYPKLKLFRHY
ncbi:MAG: cysteine desulfurase [Lachnospiraceae bacterium]|nr:cysteine desulfurase [Lachnospiraceae bacterium]